MVQPDAKRLPNRAIDPRKQWKYSLKLKQSQIPLPQISLPSSKSQFSILTAKTNSNEEFEH